MCCHLCKMSNNRVLNLSVNGVNEIKDKFQRLNIISEDWTVVDKSDCGGSTASCPISNESNNVENNSSVQNMKPYVPFPVEELTFTTTLDSWSNCNVRVTGRLQVINEAQYLESINEEGGPYKILLSFEQMGSLPLPNQVIQVFGEIKISRDDSDTVPFISVLFFRNIEVSDLCIYMEAIEYMRRYIPLFLKSEINSSDHNDTQNDEKKYYYYHQINDNSDDNTDRNCESQLYSNDDFNHAYNTDYLF